MSQAASGTEGITALKDLNLQTVLAEEGEPRTTIVAPDGEGYREVADRIRTRVQDLAGVELPIASPADSSYDVLRTSNVLLLGNAQDNPLVRRMLWERWLFDTWYPGDDGFVVRSIHNPIGAGTNVIFIGGGAPGAAGAAADAFLDSLDPGDPLAVGWTMRIGEEDQRKAPDDGTIVEYTERADRALSFKNGRNLISGAATAARRYYDTGQEGWAEVFKVYMDRHKRLGEPGMGTHMNVYDAVSMWELIEESPVFADEDRLWITDHFLYVLRSGEGCMHSWMRRDIDIVGVRHNHQTLPGVVCLFGGRYFKLGYGLPEADEWMETGARLFDGQEISHKPQCDCNNYEWGTLYQTGWWSLGSGDYTFFDNGSCRTAADRAILEMDNRGFASSNGDCWTLKYFPETLFRQAAEYYQDGRYEWAIRKHGKAIGAGGNRGVADVVRDLEPQEPVDLLGICVAPMSPHFHNAHNTTLPDQPEPNIPLEDSFDKISFRRTFDSEDQYLLLDGIGTGSHGHVDVNGVSQFTDNDRIWLMDVSYAEAPGMRDHNVVTVLRNGKTEDPPPFAALDGTADLETVGFCQTSLSDYCGMDWTRSILWSKERYFLVFDRLVAREAGDFTMRVHWRTPGEGSLEGHTFAVDQQEREPGKGTRPVVKSSRVDAFALASVGADKTAVIHDRENVGKWFESYEYSDPVVSIVQQNRAVRMAEGDSHVFANVFFVSNAEDPVDVEMRSIGEGVVLVRDGERIVCAGVGPAAFDLGGQKVQVDAEQFVLGADTIALRAGRSVDWHCPVFTSETPADVEQATDDGDGRAADLAKAWVDAADREVSATGGVSQDSHGLRDRLLAKLDAPALCMAEGNVVGRPGGPREVAVGCAKGHGHRLSREGGSIWSVRAGGGVNDLSEDGGLGHMAAGIKPQYIEYEALAWIQGDYPWRQTHQRQISDRPWRHYGHRDG
ncbi:MAG: hypothetical protein QGI83_21195, partial [Candidatus Latescibacteria bacterium]|nr:hypothetical protein [Candidatus Latescibacterota bacterium]